MKRRRPRRVAVLYGAVAADAAPDEQDVLVEVETARAALAALGFAPVAVPVTLDLEAARARLLHLKPAFAFNLVESVDGQGRLIHLAAALLDSLGIPYTGAGHDAVFLTSKKTLSKRMLAGAGLPTAPWWEPPAEMTFVGFPEGKARIVDYAAKWHEDSFEYNNTVRRFEFGPEDAALIGSLREIALACWRLFGLTGYARVDFRVDAAGVPYVLEINVNPCLSPDAGFAAAAARAGLDREQVVARIVSDLAGAPPPRRLASVPATPALAGQYGSGH